MRRPVTAAAALLPLLFAACLSLEVAEEPPPTPLASGEERIVTLSFVRFDVTDYEERSTRQDLLALPAEVRRRLWLYDLDLTTGSGARLLDAALTQIRDTPLDSPDLAAAERNLVRILRMTPDTADVGSTFVEQLFALAPRVGLAAPAILARALGIGVEDPILTTDDVKHAVLRHLVGTHPNARRRPGPVTPEHPDGLYDVPFGHLPVTLEDCASNLASLVEKLGPVVGENGGYHPGILVDAQAESPDGILGDDFAVVVRVDTNALPYKGLDATDGSVGNVSSLRSEAATLIDFNDPDWLVIEGLHVEQLNAISSVTLRIAEDDRFHAGGTSLLPAPWGDSSVWTAPRWSLEHIVADAALQRYRDRRYEETYLSPSDSGDDEDPLLTLSIDEGFLCIETKAGLGDPPPPQYVWDLILEIAQIRLHDGPDAAAPDRDRLAEGEASVELTVRDLDIGLTVERLTETIRANLQADPSLLVEVAERIMDNARGAPDFYYYRPRDVPPELSGDYLYFVAPEDIPKDDAGLPVRDYSAYARPGFFVDAELTVPASSTQPLEGDTTHEKVRVEAGTVVFFEDDAGARFELEVLPKASRFTLPIRLRRLP